MRLRHRRLQHKDSQHAHRWLVSYADYMTIMFAFFVVMYAIAINKEKEFEVFSNALEQIFSLSSKPLPASPVLPQGEGILTHIPKPTSDILYPENINTEQAGNITEQQKSPISLVKQQALGQPLENLLDELTTTLLDEIKTGQANLELTDDWLTIELSSGLLFPSASATTTRLAEQVLAQIYRIIEPVENYIRVRGYTDNQPINNEIFASNWQLSVARAGAVVDKMQRLGVNPARMAIEGYGQYSPFNDNASAQNRANNRKVVIALSKYALPTKTTAQADTPTAAKPDIEQVIKQLPVADNSIKVIELPHGGIRITTAQQP